MSTQQQQKAGQPVLSLVRDMNPDQFGKWAESLVDTGMQVLQVLNQQLSDGKISTIQAAGIMACTYGQLFDYETFHNSNALTSLYINDQLRHDS